MPWTDRSFKPHDKPVTLGNLRERKVTTLLIYCGNPNCNYSGEIQHSQWPADVTLGDFQRRMLCSACGHLGADVRPGWNIHGRPGEMRD